jgi:hypothetical protein
MFSGRGDELVALEQILFQAKHGNPQHFLLHGERGIGKSSLLFYLNCVARGDISPLEHGTFRFLVVSIELDPSNTYGDIIRKTGAELQRVVASHDRVKTLLKSAWDTIKRWEVMGVKYSPIERGVPPHELIEDLTFTVSSVIAEVSNEVDGLLLLIDEADKPEGAANLGEFAKLFTERLTTRGCQNVCLGLAGQQTLLQKLRQSHESSPRIFQIFTLDPLQWNERIHVVRKGLAEANGKNPAQTSITPDAENWIAAFSEGYPHFIQQFAHCAFDHDTDNLIDVDDVHTGASRENGAFQQLGSSIFMSNISTRSAQTSTAKCCE